MIRVGRIKTRNEDLYYEGFVSVKVMTNHKLSPYVLKKDGVILENLWQFSKVYEYVPKTTQRRSRWDQTIIWEHPYEIHISDEYGTPNEKYWEWRKKGFDCPYAVRYPVGYHHRGKCLYALENKDSTERLGYVEARKKIYLPMYIKEIRKEKSYADLLNRIKRGENILLLESDGPHQESLDYYKEKYGVDDNFIEGGTILATKKNLKIMLNDTKHAFGHGYCLALSLMKDLGKI